MEAMFNAYDSSIHGESVDNDNLKKMFIFFDSIDYETIREISTRCTFNNWAKLCRFDMPSFAFLFNESARRSLQCW